MGKIKYLVLDVDGTMTDGKIYMGQNGELFKAFNIKDGYGIHNILHEHRIEPIVITARNSSITENRCTELGIVHLYQGCSDKKNKLKEFAEHNGLQLDSNGKYTEIAYIGDDIIDIPCMEICGLTGCPADAVKQVREIADFASMKNCGDGAVRDFIEYIVSMAD